MPEISHELSEIAWCAFRDSDKPAPYNRMRDALKAYEKAKAAALAKPASEPAGGGVREAVEAEREACAKVAESLPGQRGNSPEHLVGRRIAIAIRDRALSAPASSSPAEVEALQAGVEAWKRQDGGLNADWVAMVLSEDARIEDGKLANPSYLAVKIADAADMPAEVLRLRKALAHIRDHTRETTTATMAIGALSSAPAQEDGSKDLSAHPRVSGQSASEVEKLHDKIEGLEADLDSAVEVAFNRGAIEWARLNYPAIYERLSAHVKAGLSDSKAKLSDAGSDAEGRS